LCQAFCENKQKKRRFAANKLWGSILFVPNAKRSMFVLAWRGIMERLQSTADMVRKVALWTVVGFLVVFLIGPVLTLLGVILPFALVGFVVWLPFRLFVQGKEVQWSSFPKNAGRTVRAVLGLPVRLVRGVLAVPIWLGSYIVAAILGLLRLAGGFIGLALRILFPAVVGALIFALLGAIGGVTHQDAEFRIPAAALIGAGIGALYGAFRTKPAPRVIVLKVTPAAGNQAS
jgi:hypothetical protein